MPSPFPGMNPYLEQPSCWESLHDHMAGLAVGPLVEQLRPRYLVKLGQRLYIHERSAEERRLVGRNDLGVSANEPRTGEAPEGATHIAAPAYGVIPEAIDTEKQNFIEIEDRETHEVVTAIEFLSPSNKRNASDREQYLAKRRTILHSGVHLVEIDLLRGGPRMPVEDLPECDYCAIVSRSYERPAAGIWHWTLRDEIPALPIPVHQGDADAVLELKPIIEQVHDTYAFADYIYEESPVPPLSAPDQQWANDLLDRR